jgi:hypothetical protein
MCVKIHGCERTDRPLSGRSIITGDCYPPRPLSDSLRDLSIAVWVPSQAHHRPHLVVANARESDEEERRDNVLSAVLPSDLEGTRNVGYSSCSESRRWSCVPPLHRLSEQWRHWAQPDFERHWTSHQNYWTAVVFVLNQTTGGNRETKLTDS